MQRAPPGILKQDPWSVEPRNMHFPPPPASATGYLDTATAGNYSNKRKFPRAGLNVVLSGYVETINAY